MQKNHFVCPVCPSRVLEALTGATSARKGWSVSEHIFAVGWWESRCRVLGFVGKFLTFYWTLPASWGIRTLSYRPLPSSLKNTPIESLCRAAVSVSLPLLMFQPQHLFQSCLSNPYKGKTWLTRFFGESGSVCSGLGVSICLRLR